MDYVYPKLPKEAGDPSGLYRVITPGPGKLANGICRAIRCSADGTLKLTDLSGTVVDNVPMFAGDNPLAASVIDVATSGTAPTTVIALY